MYIIPLKNLIKINYYIYARIYVCRYAAEWYNFSPKLKSLLIITLCRASIPCGLKAGNMVPLSIATYATVCTAKLQIYL